MTMAWRRLVSVSASLAIAAAVLAATPAAVFAQTGGFEDVPEDAYYSEAVTDLAARGVFAGTECEEGFCPGVALDRQTMAVWVVRVLGIEASSHLTRTSFHDVDARNPYGPFIGRLADVDITRGCGAGNFCPDNLITRAQMAVLLVRAFQLPRGTEAGFADVASGSVFRPYIDSLAKAGITVGCAVEPPRRYCPQRFVTRAQMAAFLHRALLAGFSDTPRVLITWIDMEFMTDGTLCALDVICKGLLVELYGDWEPGSHRMLCIVDGRRASVETYTENQVMVRGTWLDGDITTCADRFTFGGWTGPSFTTAHVVVRDIKSNTLTVPTR